MAMADQTIIKSRGDGWSSEQDCTVIQKAKGNLKTFWESTETTNENLRDIMVMKSKPWNSLKLKFVENLKKRCYTFLQVSLDIFI